MPKLLNSAEPERHCTFFRMRYARWIAVVCNRGGGLAFPQAVHVPNNILTACRFLLKCVIDFRFTTLIAFKHTFYDFTLSCVRHNVLPS
jgi:hypothetical protein